MSGMPTPTSDELFLVTEGAIEIHFRDRIVELAAGELLVVPRGLEHKPVVPSGVAHVVLFEPASTRNTGRVNHPYTIEAANLEKL